MVQTRLCVVTHTFLPHVGGIEKVVYEQNKRLLQRNFEPTIVTSRLGTPKHYIYDRLNVECYNSLNTGFSLGIPYPIPSIGSFATFLKAVKSSTIIHAHGHPYPSSLIAGILAKRYHKPFVLTQHNTFIKYDNFFDIVESLNDNSVGRQTLKQADRIITVSKASRDYVLRLGANPNKITVLHNGVDVERFKPMKSNREAIRRKLGIPQDAKVFLTVRRLVYKNGVDTLIECANLAIRQNSKVVFLAVGKGPDMNSVQAKINELGIQNNFRLAGFVPEEELPSYYNAADFFVLPSKSGEGLPLVALEAMACALPVIATDVGGIGEILNPKFGRLVAPNQPYLMAKAVLEFSEADWGSPKLELRAVVEEKFSWDKNVNSLAEIYEELI
jgi:glycosyltransferase involved in cell wall biosynthesis